MTNCHRCQHEITEEPMPLEVPDPEDVLELPVERPFHPYCAIRWKQERSLESHWETVAATFEPYKAAIPEAHWGALTATPSPVASITLGEDDDAVVPWMGDPWCLMIRGANGAGKSWLAARILKELVVARKEPRFAWWQVQRLGRHLKLGFADNTSAQLLDETCRVPILVLDDLLQLRLTNYVEDWCRELIADRCDSRLPTIITIDRDPKVLDDMLLSRLKEARTYTLSGGDRRGL